MLFYHDNGAPACGANGLNIFLLTDCSPREQIKNAPPSYLSRRNDEKNKCKCQSSQISMAISPRRIVMLQSLGVILSHCVLNLQHGEGTLGRLAYLGAKLQCGVYADLDIGRPNRRPNDICMEYLYTPRVTPSKTSPLDLFMALHLSVPKIWYMESHCALITPQCIVRA